MGFVVCANYKIQIKNSFINISKPWNTIQNKSVPYTLWFCNACNFFSPSILTHKHLTLSNERNFLIHKTIWKHLSKSWNGNFHSCMLTVCAYVDVWTCEKQFIYNFDSNKTQNKKKWNVGNRKMMSWNVDSQSTRKQIYIECVLWNDWNVAFTIFCLFHIFFFHIIVICWDQTEKKKGKSKKNKFLSS